MQQLLWNFSFIFLSVFLIFLGVYSLFAGYYIYRNDSYPNYFREPRAKLGKPRNNAIGILLRGFFAILFASLILGNFFNHIFPQ